MIVVKEMFAVFVLSALLYHYAAAEEGQFYGGSMSYTIEKQDNGHNVTVELITGWVLGKGPCGPGCNSSDIGRSTRTTRPLMTLRYSDYLGNYSVDYLNFTSRHKEQYSIDDIVLASFEENVIGISEHGKWEQELLHFNFIMPNITKQLDVNFDGSSWRKLSLQGSGRYHFQTTVSTKIRNDTGKPNRTPRSVTKPYYRVKLGTSTGIQIPTVDADGDLIKCDMAQFAEGGDIAIHPPPNVDVFDNCTVVVNASRFSNYNDDSWIGVAVSVRDFNKKKIVYGDDEYWPAHYSISTTAVQFLVQVLANLVTPEFVAPTLEGNHVFIMYADTSLRTVIYAEAPENTTMESFSVFGIQQEHLTLSDLQQDTKRPQVKKSILSWEPSSGEIGRHIACISSTDSTGVESSEQRCFILDVKADAFNYTTSVSPGKPFFVDIPSPNQFVSCKTHVTCVVALFVKSSIEIVDIKVTESFLDKYHLDPIQSVIHKGEQLYQSDLSFEHPIHGKEKICFIAKDKQGIESEKVCISSEIEPPDPCMSSPCLNAGTCIWDKDTGGFSCRCFAGTSGRNCAIREDKCTPDPCVKENAVICAGFAGILCYCKRGFTGDICDININDCHVDSCNRHGSCKDKTDGFDCECFSRYNGTHCEIDTCPSETDGIMSCPKVGCDPTPCQGGGVCLQGGLCNCPYGFTGINCGNRKCDISGTVTGVEIISPSLKDGSKIKCYQQGNTSETCTLRIYMTVESGLLPNNIKIDVETTSELKHMISVDPVKKSSILPGVSTLYSTDVMISGKNISTKGHFICIHASIGTSSDSVCYELDITLNPESDSTTLAYSHRNARIKFVQPTLKDRSTILCKTGEKWHILMFTSFNSTRSTCKPPGTHSSGSLTGCDSDDRDNDEDDHSGRLVDACCEDVITSTENVTVYSAHPRGPSCVTEASFTFKNAGEEEICFQSAKADFQQICYKVDVYDPRTDPCSSSPCLNNGHCFHTSSNHFKCLCPEYYTGDRCDKGPCQAKDNKCLNNAYCQTNNGTNTCICKAGYSGQTCNKEPSDLKISNAEFTDTAKPSDFPCVIHRKCSIALLLTGISAALPTISPGYVDSSLLLEEIETVDRMPIQNSFQTNIKIMPLELGVKDMCIQTKTATGVNEDELCFKVNVISDVISLYGLKDRPHFIEPSMPANTRVECVAEGPCHVIYHVTPGTGNENECVNFHTTPPDGFVNFRLFSSCDNCTRGGSGSGNCTVDVSIVSTNADINSILPFCVTSGLIGSQVEGESRCFNLTITDPNNNVKKGCQILECRNGGFCDGHVPAHPVCYCSRRFSGTNCEKAEVQNDMPNAQTQSFVGDLAVPTEITCIVRQSCSLPFQVFSKYGVMPIVTLGFNGPYHVAETPILKNLSSTVFEGYALVKPHSVGQSRLCLQTHFKSKTEDELCVSIEVISGADHQIDLTKPYYIPPTLTTDSTVLCAFSKPCHFDMHFTKGDAFGFVGRCPTLTKTSQSPVEGVHIFEAKIEGGHCTTDVSFVSPTAHVEHYLCLQIALPGKKGENRCYTVKVVNDTNNEVISPCRGVTCEHNGKCLADFSSNPPLTSCICTSGFTGIKCHTAYAQETCNFDDGNLCGWQQQNTDNFDWTFQNGPTMSVDTGPNNDHTLGTTKGKYLYVEASSPNPQGYYASLISPVQPANHTRCLELWYYMYGDGIGNLFVLLQDTRLKKVTQIFKQTGDHGAHWIKASVTIDHQSIPNDYSIIIKADVGPTYHGDTAIDDLVITDGHCKGNQGAPLIG